ncbi:hypothetical protein [Desertivirga arenae]|uniref:hypothetical protein n=1 Tax=Desertivirga arenae TaxID=2810309 RepID=UPI001A95B915|nr:hypothetical protein [Pedobacter sp. SYSU D00823]
MDIYSYAPRSSEGCSSSSLNFEFRENGYNQVDDLLYYLITTTDFNSNGKPTQTGPGICAAKVNGVIEKAMLGLFYWRIGK